VIPDTAAVPEANSPPDDVMLVPEILPPTRELVLRLSMVEDAPTTLSGPETYRFVVVAFVVVELVPVKSTTFRIVDDDTDVNPFRRVRSPAISAVPEANSPPVLLSTDPVTAPEAVIELLAVIAPSTSRVPVALILAPVKSPEKNAPPCTASDLENAADVVPSSHVPDVAVIPPTLRRSNPSASMSDVHGLAAAPVASVPHCIYPLASVSRLQFV